MTHAAEATPFVGRTRELAELRRAFLAGHHLVTLRGSAGAGKTRLARRFASFQPKFAWVDAAEARDADALGSAVQEALGVEAEAIDGLAAAGRLLVVLDNLEQVAEVAAQLIPQWRAAAPDVRFLTTSRTRLKLPEEQLVIVGPMPMDDTRSDAVRLFGARARSVSGRDVVSEDPEAVLDLVRRLDGLPLALELAAGRTGAMGPREILDRIEASLALLHDESLNLPDRQATLRAAIHWSWELLDDDERDAMARCGIFAGDFDLHAAEAVLGAGAPDALQALCDDSLVHVTPDGAGGLRYRLYEAVRDFVRPHLAAHPARDAIEAAHAEHFASEAALAHTLAWTARNRHHLFAILERCTTDSVADRSAFLAATVALARVPHLAGTPADQRARLARALSHDSGCPTALRVHGRLVRALHDPSDDLDDAFALVGRNEALVTAVHARRSSGLLAQGDRVHALRYALDAAAFEPTEPATARELARCLVLCDRFDDARGLLCRLHVADDDVRGAIIADMARIALLEGDVGTAAVQCDQAIALLEGPESVPERADAHRLQACVHWLAGALPEAASSAHAALEVSGWRRGLALALRAALGDIDAWESAQRSIQPTAPAVAHAILDRYRVLIEDPTGDHGAAHTLEGRVVDAVRAAVHGATQAREWVMGPDGKWFRTPDGEEVDLSRRGAMRRILDALVEQRIGAGEPLATETLFDLGWPGQAIRGDSAAHRVRVAVSSLRTAGLGDLIVKDEDGYRIPEDVPMRRG